MVLTAYGEEKDFLCSEKYIQDARNVISRERGYLAFKWRKKKKWDQGRIFPLKKIIDFRGSFVRLAVQTDVGKSSTS